MIVDESSADDGQFDVADFADAREALAARRSVGFGDQIFKFWIEIEFLVEFIGKIAFFRPFNDEFDVGQIGQFSFGLVRLPYLYLCN